jgi:putative hydrolase of HD superfamily
VQKLDPKTIIENLSVLKNIPRTGWLQRGIPPSVAETVAEHSFEVVSFLSIIAIEGGEGLDKEKMLIMGTIHDWGEAVAGDIPKSFATMLGDGVKSGVELKIMEELSTASGLENLMEIFKEYEGRRTNEAIVVKIADILSTLRQAKVYAARGYDVKDIIDGCGEELGELMGRLEKGKALAAIQKLLQAL